MNRMILFLLLLSTIFVYQSDENRFLNEQREDITFLLQHLHAMHPAFKSNNEVVSHVSNALATTDHHSPFSIQLMKAVAKIDDPHTNVLLSDHVEKLPLSLVNIDNAVYITHSYHPQAKKGDKILAIGGKEINEVLEELREYIAYDHEGWFQHMVNLLTIDEILQSIGLDKNEKVELKVERNGKVITFAHTYVAMESLANNHEPYKWEILQQDKKKVGYFQIIDSVNDYSYRQALASFFEEVKEEDINKIILDLRSNSGGDSTVADEWMSYLDVDQYLHYRRGKLDNASKVTVTTTGKGNYKGDLYVLTGPGTFSSGTMFATILKDNNLGKIIGEPAGMNPNHEGEVAMVELPHSKIRVAISQEEFVRPVLDPVGNELLSVDIPLSRTIADIMNGDGQLAKAIEIINGD